jgi:hypothetical protein
LIDPFLSAFVITFDVRTEAVFESSRSTAHSMAADAARGADLLA